MLRRAIAGLVCTALVALPLSNAQAQAPWGVNGPSPQGDYPGAMVIRVSAEDYPALAQSLRQAGYQPREPEVPRLLLAANELSSAPEPAPVSSRSGADCDEQAGQASDTRTQGTVGVDIRVGNGGHRGGRGSGSSGNDAVVLFVIVGAVVLVVWTLYALKYAVDSARGAEFCGERWSEWALTTTSINSYAPQYANFTGLRYLGGIGRGITNFGISAELGNADVLLAGPGTLRMQGLYWLVGPLLRWRLSEPGFNPSYFQMEFLAGSTENPEMGLIATAKLGLNFGLTDRLRLGISYGALNMNLHEQGMILDRSRYYTVWGLDLGLRF